MLARIKAFFDEQIMGEGELDNPIGLVSRAAAALLIEVTRADYADDPRELEAVRDALRATFLLEEKELDELMEMADSEATEATSSYDFTRLVNEHFGPNQKLDLIYAMWQVAYADDDLDKYEEHLIRRIAELIYVPHNEFIRLKHEAARESGAD
jgi:uncharacterized tellurite resistance protein B-like protein